MKKLLLMFIAMIFVFTGCSNKNLTEENAKLIVKDFLTDYQAMDFDGMYNLTHDAHPYFQGMYNNELESNRYMFETLSNRLEYLIGDIEINGKEATVTVTTTNIDVEKVLSNITADYLTICNQNADKPDFDFNTTFMDVTKQNFDNPNNETITHQTVFNLVEKNKKWAIESNIMIYDDITGGYMTYYYENVVFSDLMNGDISIND